MSKNTLKRLKRDFIRNVWLTLKINYVGARLGRPYYVHFYILNEL
jgi:hypothetical protein